MNPKPVFVDAEQIWLNRLDEAARRLYPDTDAAAHAKMLIGWRALLPFSERNTMLLGDKELKAAGQLAGQQANWARIIGQSPVPTLLEKLSKAMASSGRSWFGKKEDPDKLVAALKAQEPAVQKSYDDLQDAAECSARLHTSLEAFFQAAHCLVEVGEESWRPALESRRHLLHQAVYNLELSQAHLQQHEKLLVQWREDIQRLVYLIYPNWQLGQS